MKDNVRGFVAYIDLHSHHSNADVKGMNTSQTVLFESCRIRAYAKTCKGHSHPTLSSCSLGVRWTRSMIRHHFPYSSGHLWRYTPFSDTPKWKFPKLGVPPNHPELAHFSIETHGDLGMPLKKPPTNDRLCFCWTQFMPQPSRNL